MSFLYEADKARDLVVDGGAARAKKEADFAIGKIANDSFEDGQSEIVLINAEKNFVFGIVLTAEAGVILVGILIEPLDGFEATDRRRKVPVRERITSLGNEEPNRAEDNKRIVDERDRGEAKQNKFGDRGNLSTSPA